MNTPHDTTSSPPAVSSLLHPSLAAAMEAERARAPSQPSIVSLSEEERSMLAVRHDPTLTTHDQSGTDLPQSDPGMKDRARVRWVRPTELALQSGTKAAEWGLDLRAELARRLHTAQAGQTQRRQSRTEGAEPSERTKRLPDLSIAGRRAPRREGNREPVSGGMGLR